MTTQLTTHKNTGKKVAVSSRKQLVKGTVGGGLLAAYRSNEGDRLTSASIIYGIGGAVFFAVALYFLFTGRWLTGLLVLFPCVSLLGFALHYIDRQD